MRGALAVAVIVSGCWTSSVPGEKLPAQRAPDEPTRRAPDELASRAPDQPEPTDTGEDLDPQPGGTASPRAIKGALPRHLLRRLSEKLRPPNDSIDRLAEVLSALIDEQPQYLQLHLMSCDVELARRRPKAPAAQVACERAIALTGDVETEIEVSKIHRRRGDLAGAEAGIASALKRLEKLPPGEGSAGWLALAGHYRDQEMLRAAEDALAKANVRNDEGIGAWATSLRVRFGLPRDGARYRLLPQDELDALTVVRDVFARADRKDHAAATRSAGFGERRWPGLPGLVAGRCRLALDRGALTEARQLCDRSLAAFESSLALYLSAAIDLRETPKRVRPEAVDKLRRVIEIDRSLVEAWHLLAHALGNFGMNSELEHLRMVYRSRFLDPAPW